MFPASYCVLLTCSRGISLSVPFNFLYLQLQRINDEQKNRILKTERAIQVAEVHSWFLSSNVFWSYIIYVNPTTVIRKKWWKLSWRLLTSLRKWGRWALLLLYFILSFGCFHCTQHLKKWIKWICVKTIFSVIDSQYGFIIIFLIL